MQHSLDLSGELDIGGGFDMGSDCLHSLSGGVVHEVVVVLENLRE